MTSDEENAEQHALKDAAIAMLAKVACRTSASYEYEIDVLRGALRDGLAIVNNISMAVKFADDKAAFNAFSAWVDQARAAIDRTDWRAPDFKAEGGT
jgi:hypothetical protein